MDLTYTIQGDVFKRKEEEALNLFTRVVDPPPSADVSVT